jgi:WD40 repeat protein
LVERSRSSSPLPNRAVVPPLNQSNSAPVSISVSPPPGSGSRASSGKDGLSSAGSSRKSSYVPEDSANESSEEKRMGDYHDSDRESGSFDRFDEVLEEDEIKTVSLIWPTPFRTFVGHTLDVIDISWSKSHFILSASADHNVRLWHVTRGDCLQVFRHPDIATSIDFHPLHDRYFVSGCFDRKLRIWDIISDALNKEWVSLSETVSEGILHI